MHEQALIGGLIHEIQSVATTQHARKVVGVTVTIGVRSHMSPDHFRAHFARAARGTLAEGAYVDLEVLNRADDPRAQDVILDSIEVEH